VHVHIGVAEIVAAAAVVVVDVDDPRIADIYAAKVSAAVAVSRVIRLAETQRAPAVAVSTTEADPHSPSSATKPGD
jgi:hypothetical protein